MNGVLDIHPTPETLALGSARHIASLLEESVGARGTATLALSGGSTPRAVYAALGSEPLRSEIPWKSVHVFWGDERCVPATHPDSNFRMAGEALLWHIEIPAENIHRIKGELVSSAASAEYEEELRSVFALHDGALPRFDVILLGLGDDGHTASLFPGTAALEERGRLVTSVYVEHLKSNRVTLTLPVINNARHLLFVVSGIGKSPILTDVLGPTGGYPAQRVRPVDGDLRWLIDRDAASQLEQVSLP